jgi:hypothetical protein
VEVIVAPGVVVIISTAGDSPDCGIMEVPGVGPVTIRVLVENGTVTMTAGRTVPLPETVVVPAVG